MSSDTLISIREVSKRFGSVLAVDEVSIDIRRGEFFSLLGASGCGKTTLLRMLAGFEMPSAGEIHIDGEPMSGMPPYSRPTNMVFQNYAIFPHLDVRGNIAYALKKEKLSRSEVDERVREALAMIKMQGFEDRRATQLSGGQQQRVALARALVNRPKVLLLDEPLGALDKKLRGEMQLELRSLQQELGITFVFVTHDQEEALTMSDRIAVMSSGHVLQIDTPSHLYDAPNCREVAAFIGSMNFFDGTVAGSDGDQLLIEAGGIGRVRANGRSVELARGQAGLTLAVRPEKLNLTTRDPGAGHNVVAGSLLNMAYMGDRVTYFVRIPGHDAPIAVSAQTGDRFEADAVAPGASVWVTWRPEAVVVLPETAP